MKQESDREVSEFNRAVDRLIRAPTKPDYSNATHDTAGSRTDQGLLDVAQSLASANPASFLADGEAIWRQVATPQRRAARRPAFGWRPAMATLVLILLLAFVLLPPLRTFAQEIIIRIGTLSLTQEQTSAQRTIEEFGGPQLVPAPERQELSPAEVLEQAGFAVLVPGWVPEGHERSPIRVNLDEKGVYVSYAYLGPSIISVLASKAREGEEISFPVGEGVEAEPVEVRGQPGQWIEEAPTGMRGIAEAETPEDIEWFVSYDQILAWEEDGISYMIVSESNKGQPYREPSGDSSPYIDPELSLEELLRITESMVPLQP